MNTQENLHITLLELAAAALAALPWKFVFIGGATISLYLDDPAAEDIRVTKDVDCVVSATTYIEYVAVEEALRQEGFGQLVDKEGPICRWTREGLILDIMPVEPQLLGFGQSRWFREGFANAQSITLPSGRIIQIFDVFFLLAAKIEAFRDRAQGDYLISKDFEDIATILNGKRNIFDELSHPGAPQTFVLQWLKQYTPGDLEEMLASHIGDYRRSKWLVERIMKIA